MRQEIKIRTNNNELLPVVAEVINGVALHRSAMGGYGLGVKLSSEDWSITHVQSGGRMKQVVGDHATACAEFLRLASYRHHGVLLGDMSGCELCANALALNGAISDNPKPAEVVLQIAADAAELLACSA